MPTAGIDHTEDKESLRSRLRSAVRTLTAEEREAGSSALRPRILGSKEWAEARRIAFYHPRTDEPDLLPLVEACWVQGREAAFPGWDPSTGSYVFRLLRDWRELQVGPFGIREPAQGCPVAALESLDLVFVPGIGFTTEGRRLGRGRGFYDRLLRSFHGVACGVCFDVQLVEWIPVEPHDVPMKRVLAPNLPERRAGQAGVE